MTRMEIVGVREKGLIVVTALTRVNVCMNVDVMKRKNPKVMVGYVVHLVAG